MKKRTVSVLLALIMLFILAACGGVDKAEKPNDDDGSPANEEIDMSKYPKYIDPNSATYKFDFEQMTTPYILGNVIYNETVLLIDDGTTVSGKLQYAPVKILSVRDYTWENEYPASDYSVSGNTLTVKATSQMPHWTSANLKGRDMPEEYEKVSSITNPETQWMMMGAAIYTESSLIYGHQISVSYVYDVKDLKRDEFADYTKSGFPETKAKLTAGEDVKIVAIGDSVAEGCSSSKKFNHEPFMDNWVTQSTQALDGHYEGSVTCRNVAKGGMASAWGAAPAQINSIMGNSAEDAPDLLIVHFGINDLGAHVSAEDFYENMSVIVADVLDRAPDCEIMLIKAFPANASEYNYNGFKEYWQKIDDIVAEYPEVYSLDMFTLGTTMLTQKKYMDVTGNGINHVNDFSSRIYTMNILSALLKY